MARKRTAWSVEQIADFVKWHEGRMAELNYPPKLCAELRESRDKFLPAPIESKPNAR